LIPKLRGVLVRRFIWSKLTGTRFSPAFFDKKLVTLGSQCQSSPLCWGNGTCVTPLNGRNHILKPQKDEYSIVWIGLVHLCVSQVIQTTEGPVSGFTTANSRIFLGIPYAAPPINELRWKAPRPHPKWTQTRDATKFVGLFCVIIDFAREMHAYKSLIQKSTRLFLKIAFI
jgi:hypothetical protein